MTSYTSFEELEASVPLTQLQPSLAFARCAAHLPEDVDQLHGDELIASLERALTIHSKARVVLQCWVLLIMRRRVDATHEKDALYALLQQAALNPQEKIRYRRGAMLLCHLLVEREAAQGDSLLDRYLTNFYFPWSSAVNVRNDMFYLQANVIDWVRQAWDYLQQNGSNMMAVRWLELTTASATAASPPLESELQELYAIIIQPTTPSARRVRGRDSERSLPPPSSQSPAAQQSSRPSTTHKKRRRTSGVSAHHELETLKEAIELWAKRLRGQLLRAALCNDSVRVRQIADELRAPSLVYSTDDGESGEQAPRGRRGGRDATTSDSDDGNSDSLSRKNCRSARTSAPFVRRSRSEWSRCGTRAAATAVAATARSPGYLSASGGACTAVRSFCSWSMGAARCSSSTSG